MTNRLNIGAVSYLNTKPLVHTLEQRLADCRLTFDLPSRLADQLSTGQLDVALIPSVEHFRLHGSQVVSDAVIGCRGPVWSVRLLSRVPVAEIGRLALDEGSRTSAALVQVLLWEQYGLRPELQPLKMQQDPAAVDADALLLIGDRAMHPAIDRYCEIWDLGDRWCRMTELPFVFAMWVARPGLKVDTSVVAALQASRDAGLADVESIAETEAGRCGLTVPDCLTYFTENLHFRLTAGERNGLALFRQKCESMGLIPGPSQDRHSRQSDGADEATKFTVPFSPPASG